MISNNVSTSPRLSEVLEFIDATELSGEYKGIPVQINFLRNFTIEGVEPYLKYHLLSSGLEPNIVFGNYDMIQQEVLVTTSHIYSASPDIIVVALHLETYVPDSLHGGWTSDEVMKNLVGLFLDIAQNTDAIVTVNTFVPPFYSDLGITSNSGHPSIYHEVLQLNQLIREFVRSNDARFVLVDSERIVRLLGEGESMDYRFWYMSKAPFKKSFLDHYALELAKIARALKGKSKKCLVLDCDNTLWGGIVGEDGPQGIKLDRHSYPGNAFYEFQKSILNLHKRGVLIALCSKNNDHDVWEILDNHQHSVLKREHLTAWRINWQDKATNLRELANELNIGLDSFVFVDDNPVECGIIRDMTPEVTVLQVPEKLYSFPRILDRDGLFDTLTLSAEDGLRSKMYRDEATRKQEKVKYETLEQYLESLSISIAVHQVKPDEIPRVAQLTQKTNQFNLTTRRYSEAQISSFVDDPIWSVFSLSVRDKFGDSGLTGVLIARNDGHSGVIDTLLMSCRIIGRNIELAFVLKALEIMEHDGGINSWKAEYIPTKKNNQVEDFWDRFGFTEDCRQEGCTVYELSSGTSRLKKIPYILIEEE